MAGGQISVFAQITAKVEEKRGRVLDGGFTLACVWMGGTILGAEVNFIIPRSKCFRATRKEPVCSRAGFALQEGLGEIKRPIAGQLLWLLSAGERGKGSVQVEISCHVGHCGGFDFARPMKDAWHAIAAFP